jgi:hypothetical protein
VYEYDAQIYRDGQGSGNVVQKTYLCSNDVSIQYVYWEVLTITNCTEFFADFLGTLTNFPPYARFRFATEAEAAATIDPARPLDYVQAFSIFCDIGDERETYTYYQVVTGGGET